jgi:Innexin
VKILLLDEMENNKPNKSKSNKKTETPRSGIIRHFTDQCVKSLQSLLRICLKNEEIGTDFSFRLCTLYTSVFATALSLVVVGFAGTYNLPLMNCYSDDSPEGTTDGARLTKRCLAIDTFLVVKHIKENAKTYPGVGSFEQGSDDLHQLGYYKFLFLTLLMHAALSFLPWWLYRRRALRILAKHILGGEGPSRTGIKQSKRFENLSYGDGTFEHHRLLNVYTAHKFAALLTLITSSILTIALIDRSRFYAFGVNVIRQRMSVGWSSDIARYFPLVAKCVTAIVGHSGDTQYQSAMCDLGWNTVYRHLFLLLWWWLAAVSTVSIVGLIWFALSHICDRRRQSSQLNRICSSFLPHKPSRNDRFLMSIILKNMTSDERIAFNARLLNDMHIGMEQLGA